MKLLLVVALLTLPATAKKELTWTTAVVESSSRQRYDNGGVSGPYGTPTLQIVRESIYLDAGAWLYHATQIVNVRSTLDLPDGARVDVAEDGKKLILRVNGKQYKLSIEQRSRGRN